MVFGRLCDAISDGSKEPSIGCGNCEIIRLIPVSITVLRGWAGQAVISAARLVVNLYRTQIVTAAASLATARAAPVTFGCATTCLTFWRRLQRPDRKDSVTTVLAFDDSTV